MRWSRIRSYSCFFLAAEGWIGEDDVEAACLSARAALGVENGLRQPLRFRLKTFDQIGLAIDDRFEQAELRFTWLVGTQVATLVAIIAVLVGALFR